MRWALAAALTLVLAVPASGASGASPEEEVVLTPLLPGELAPPQGKTITARTGLWDGKNRGWFGTYPSDWDRDGDIDVLMGPHGGTRYLMQNDGTGSFVQIFRRVIPPDDRHGCAWGDPNQDERPDLYCVIGAGRGLERKTNELFIQQADGTFVDRAGVMGVTDPFGRGREAGWVDANDDGWPDLYVSNHFPRKDNKPSTNRLYINEQGEGFHSAPAFGVDKNIGNPINVHGCVLGADVNGDGRDDLLTCGEKRLRVFIGGPNRFDERTSHENVRPGLWYHAVLADMNRDERPDLVGATRDGLVVQIRQKNGWGAAFVRRIDQARQVAVGDVNGDGINDVYLVTAAGPNGNLPDMMLVNHGSGREYSRAPLPRFRRGIGDSASAADLDGDGRDEIIVTHGGEHHKGPVQVLTFEDAT